MIKFIGIVLALIAVILIIVFWDQISAIFPTRKPADGTPCSDTNGNTGAFKDGVCITGGGRPDTTVVERIVPAYTYPYPYTFLNYAPRRARLVNGSYYI